MHSPEKNKNKKNTLEFKLGLPDIISIITALAAYRIYCLNVYNINFVILFLSNSVQ